MHTSELTDGELRLVVSAVRSGELPEALGWVQDLIGDNSGVYEEFDVV